MFEPRTEGGGGALLKCGFKQVFVAADAGADQDAPTHGSEGDGEQEQSEGIA